MDELKYGQLDTGFGSGRRAISSTDVHTEVLNTDFIMGGEEHTRDCGQAY